jgi:hypothetical protein
LYQLGVVMGGMSTYKAEGMNRYDIFISYRWVGDVAYEYEGRGWVAGFKDALESKLLTRLGREVRIFLDVEEMARHEPLHQALRTAIESTALFLSIVTESSSQEGSWARWELGHFVNSAHPVCGPPATRIFKAALYPADRTAEPEILRDRAEYRFYGRFGRDADGRPFPYQLAQLLDPEKEPGVEFDRLADDLAERLAGADAPAATPPDGDRLIYVASSNLAAKRERLCGDLRGRGYRIVAETPWPGCSAEEFHERAGARLVEADASIHLTGGPRQTPPGWNESVSEIELHKAMDVAARPEKGSFRIFTWEENEPALSAGSSARPREALLARLSQVRGVTNFNGKGWEYMLSNVFLGLKGLRLAAGEPVVPPNPPTDCTCQVFVHCLEDDRTLAQEIRDKLLDHKVWVCFLPQTLKFWRRLYMRGIPLREDARIVDRFRRFYRECDGALVLYGRSTEFWALDRCDEIHDFFGDQLAAKAPAICLAPPEDEVKRCFQYRGFSRYRLEEIENYVRRLPCNQPRAD